MACSTCGTSKKQQIKAQKAQQLSKPKTNQKVVVTSLPLDRIKPIK